MKTSMMVGAVALALATVASSASAQFVQAGVVIRSGPVRGHVVVANRPPVVVYREPVRRVVVVERYQPRTIMVERIDGRRYRPSAWWRRHGYGVTTVYYDDNDDCYYDRRVSGRRGLREVTVYLRDGRYYRADRERDRGDDRYRRRYDNRNWDD